MRVVGDDGRASAASMAEYADMAARWNDGFARVERLRGNLGNLDIRTFYRPEYAGDTAVAAMALVAHTGALIIDLRRHGGGSPLLGFLLASYLVGPAPVHLHDFIARDAEASRPAWIYPYVPGRCYGAHKPVYLLTGPGTISAGEGFAYDMQSIGRAVVVGAATAGAANPGAFFRLTDDIAASIPTGYVVNAVTGGNWEGSGVVPDVVVPEAAALAAAQSLALGRILEVLGEDTSVAGQALAGEARRALDEPTRP